jgi:hypothetical protein
MNIREISDVFKDTANQITAIKSYNFGWASDRTRSTNTEDYQELNEFPRVFFSVPTITGSDQTRKQDTYQVTIFFDDLLGYNNEGDADLTLQIDKWAALQEYANYFVQRLNKVKQSILPNYLFIPEAPSITFDSFTGLQRMITVQLSFTLVVPTNCEPVVSKLVECIANILTSSNLIASITRVIKLVSTLQASSSLSASALVSKLAQSNLNTESSLAANIQIAKLASSSLNAGAILSANALITRLFAASLNGNGSLFANPLITKFAASSLNANASLAASALVSKLAASSLTGAGTLAGALTVTGSALLLDTYPNAAAAYSLRKLRTAYAGSAIQVRRSSDNNVQDIGFVSGNLDTVSLLAFCGVGNGFVTTWYDQSGNAINASQGTAVNQPQIVVSGVVNLENNKPAIIGTATSGLKTASINFSTFNNLSFFKVFKTVFNTSLEQDQIIIESSTNFNDNTGAFIINSNFNNYGAIKKVSVGYIYNTYTPYINNIVIIKNTYLTNLSGLSFSEMYDNNVIKTEQLIQANGSSNFTNQIMSIGSRNGNSFGIIGSYQEIIMYGSNQFSNQTAINTNINTHYAIY